MTCIQRFRPDPIPAIHPLPEYLATGQRSDRYGDTKQVLQVPFQLMEYHHVDEPTRAVYDDIKSILRSPFVNADCRAFARWPSYFALALKGLRQKAISPDHESICQACHERVADLVATELPKPGGLSLDVLRRAADTDASLVVVIQVCRLFQWLIPGLKDKIF